MRRLGIAAVLTVAAAGMLAAPISSLSAAATITAIDFDFTGGSGSGGAFELAAGEQPRLVNGGVSPHNATARQDGPDGKALFRSPTLGEGESGIVSGTQYLSGGEYELFCTIHPFMEGTLVVSGGGQVARPKIKVSIRSRALGKVRKTGRLKARIRAATESPNAKLVAKLGKLTLAKKSNLDLAAGEKRTLALKLSRKSRRRLDGRSKASVKLIGKVPFGASASARRVLR